MYCTYICNYAMFSFRSSLIKHQRFDHSKKIAFIVNLNNAQRIDAHIKLSSNPRVLEMSEEPVTKMIKLVKSSPDKNEMGESSAKGKLLYFISSFYIYIYIYIYVYVYVYVYLFIYYIT